MTHLFSALVTLSALPPVVVSPPASSCPSLSHVALSFSLKVSRNYILDMPHICFIPRHFCARDDPSPSGHCCLAAVNRVNIQVWGCLSLKLPPAQEVNDNANIIAYLLTELHITGYLLHDHRPPFQCAVCLTWIAGEEAIDSNIEYLTRLPGNENDYETPMCCMTCYNRYSPDDSSRTRPRSTIELPSVMYFGFDYPLRETRRIERKGMTSDLHEAIQELHYLYGPLQ